MLKNLVISEEKKCCGVWWENGLTDTWQPISLQTRCYRSIQTTLGETSCPFVVVKTRVKTSLQLLCLFILYFSLSVFIPLFLSWFFVSKYFIRSSFILLFITVLFFVFILAYNCRCSINVSFAVWSANLVYSTFRFQEKITEERSLKIPKSSNFRSPVRQLHIYLSESWQILYVRKV